MVLRCDRSRLAPIPNRSLTSERAQGTTVVAVQDSPGGDFKQPMWRKGVSTMVKRVLIPLKVIQLDALVIIGWPAFVSGVLLAGPIWLEIILLSTARVLP